jgi:hypothetical protein
LRPPLGTDTHRQPPSNREHSNSNPPVRRRQLPQPPAPPPVPLQGGNKGRGTGVGEGRRRRVMPLQMQEVRSSVWAAGQSSQAAFSRPAASGPGKPLQQAFRVGARAKHGVLAGCGGHTPPQPHHHNNTHNTPEGPCGAPYRPKLLASTTTQQQHEGTYQQRQQCNIGAHTSASKQPAEASLFTKPHQPAHACV